MFGARALLSYIHDRFASGSTSPVTRSKDAALEMAALTTALHSRELSGKRTTLRQLHHIAELTQPEALALVDRLERSDIVSIDRNIADAFESIITLSDDTRRRLDRVVEGKAA